MTGHFTWCGACGRSHSLPGGKLDVAASSSRVRTILRLLRRGRSAPPDLVRTILRPTVTVERIDGGKLRCTGATWSDAVVIFPGEVLAFQNIERQAHALRAPSPGGCGKRPAGSSPIWRGRF